MNDSLVAWLHVGDLHASAEDGWQSVDRLRRIVDAVRDDVPPGTLDFAYLPGDHANHAEPEQYRRIAAELERLPLEVHAIPGDHDFEDGSLAAFRAFARRSPPYSIAVGGRRALFLDLVSAGSGGPDFRLGERQTRWLRDELDAARSAGEARPLVFMHAFPSDLARDAEAIARLFVDHDVAFVDTGHTHYNEIVDDGRVVYSATRSTGQIEEGPPGFAIAAVDGDVASWRFKALDDGWPWVLVTAPGDVRMAVRGTPTTPSPHVRAIVLGRDVHAVSLTIDDEPPRPMAPSPTRPGLWTVEVGAWRRAPRRLRVTATDRRGRTGSDDCVVARDAVGDGPWIEHGVLGTKLGPNANGHPW